jgi:hypothetical protein
MEIIVEWQILGLAYLASARSTEENLDVPR